MAAVSQLNHQGALNAHRRQLIVDAAQRVFEDAGLEGASIRAIAEAAGCTTGAIYPHFDGKEAVFAAVLGRALDGLLQTVEDAMREKGTALKALRSGALAFYKYYDQRPSELALALYLFNGIRPRKLGGALDTALSRQLESVLAMFSEKIRVASNRSFRPVVEVESTALFTYLVGLLILRHNGRIRSLDKNAAVLLAFYVRTLLQRLKAAQPRSG